MTSPGYTPAEYPPMAPFIDLSDLPKPLTLRLDEPASISVRVSGCPRPTVKWQIGRKRVKESSKFHMESNADQTHVLAISRVTRDLEQGVWVTATSVLGEDCTMVEVRTLEIVFKQRAFKKDQNSAKRATSLNNERRANLPKANSCTNSLSAQNNSINSLKDWTDEMAVRNTMCSVDDLVFASDRASLTSGLGYSLSVNMADSDDPDLLEQFHTLSKRSRRRRPPPVRTSASLVFQELEPRLSRPDHAFQTPARIKESEHEESNPSRTHPSDPLPGSVQSDKTPKILEDVQNVVDTSNKEKTETKTKTKKKTETKIKQSTPTTTISCDKYINNRTVITGAAASDDDDDDDNDDDGDDDDDRERNVCRDNFEPEDDSVWAMFRENQSKYCQDIFDKFPKIETKNDSQLELLVEGSKPMETSNNADQGTSKFGVLRNVLESVQTDRRIDKKRTTKQRGNIGKSFPGERLTEESTNGMSLQNPEYNPLNKFDVEDISEVKDGLLKVTEKRTKRPKRPNSLSSSSKANQPEVLIEEPYCLKDVPLFHTKSDAKKQNNRKNRSQKQKSEANLNINDVKLDENDDRNEAENDLELRHQNDDKEPEEEEEYTTQNPVATKKRTKNKETVPSTKSNKPKKSENGSTQPELGPVKHGTIIADDISDSQDKDSIKAASVATPLVKPVPLPTITTEEIPGDMKSSSPASKSRHRKKSTKTKRIEKVPLSSSYTVIAGDGFIVEEMENYPRDGRLLSESKEILATNSNLNSEHLSKFLPSKKSENLTTEIILGKPKKEKKTKKSKLIKSNFNDKSDKTELLVTNDEILAINSEKRNSLSIESENSGPVLDYCNEPIRLRPTSSRVRNVKSSDVRRKNDFEQVVDNRKTHDTPVDATSQNMAGNRSTGKISEQTESKQELVDQELIDQELVDHELVDQELVDHELIDHELVGQELADHELVGQELVGQELVDQELVKWTDNAQNISTKKSRKNRNKKNRKSTKPEILSTTCQSETPTDIKEISLELAHSKPSHLPVMESSPVLHAHETSILKSLAEKLNSGQIEIIIINKDSKSNESESKIGSMNLRTLLNLCSAKETEKATTQRESEDTNSVDRDNSIKESKETIQHITNGGKETQVRENRSDSPSPAYVSSELTGESLRRDTDTPVPKPRTISLNRHSMMEFKTENFAGKDGRGRTISPSKDVAELGAASEFGSLFARITAEDKPEKLDEQSPVPSDVITVSKPNYEALDEQSLESKRKFFKNRLRQHNSQKEDLKSPAPKKSQEPHLGETTKSKVTNSTKVTNSKVTNSEVTNSKVTNSKVDSSTQVSPSSSVSGSNRHSNSSTSSAVKSRSIGCQTDATLMTSLPGDVITQRRHHQTTSSPDDVITQRRHHQTTSSPDDVITKQSSLSSEITKSDLENKMAPKGSSLNLPGAGLEEPSRQVSFDSSSVANGNRTYDRQRPIRTYVPVFPSYFHGYGSVYQRPFGSDHIRNGGVMRSPGDGLPEPLSNLANPTQDRHTTRQPVNGDGGRGSSINYGQIVDRNSSVSKISEKNERDVGFTGSKGKFQGNSLSNSSPRDSSSVRVSEQAGSRSSNSTIDSNLETASIEIRSPSLVEVQSDPMKHHHSDGNLCVQCPGLSVFNGEPVDASPDQSTRTRPETVVEEENFITSAVTHEYEEIIKLYPAN